MNTQTIQAARKPSFNPISMLKVSRIHSKRDQAVKKNQVWDLSSQGCAMPDEKISGNLLFLLQRRTQNFVRIYLRTEDVADTKLNNVLESKIKDQASLIQLLRLAKFGLRELANEADAFGYDNVYKYVKDNGIEMFSSMSAKELSNAVTINNERFIELVKKEQYIPFCYYALIKYALKIMLQRHIENNGECEMA